MVLLCPGGAGTGTYEKSKPSFGWMPESGLLDISGLYAIPSIIFFVSADYVSSR